MQKCDYCGTTQGALVTMCGMCRLEREPVEIKTDWKDELIGELENACKYVIDYHRENDSGEGELFGLDFVTTCITVVAKIRDLKKQGKLSIRIGERLLPVNQPEQDGHKSAQ